MGDVPPFLTLPIELIQAILDLLALPDRCRAARVCRTFFHATQTSAGLRAIDFGRAFPSTRTRPVFYTAARARNHHAAVKLAVAHLYNVYGINEMFENDVTLVARAMAEMIVLAESSPDAPADPITWSLFRGPWPSDRCIKRLVFDQISMEAKAAEPGPMRRRLSLVLARAIASDPDRSRSLEWLEVAGAKAVDLVQRPDPAGAWLGFPAPLDVPDHLIYTSSKSPAPSLRRLVGVDWMLEIFAERGDSSLERFAAAVDLVDRTFHLPARAAEVQTHLAACMVLADRVVGIDSEDILTVNNASILTNRSADNQQISRFIGLVLAAAKGRVATSRGLPHLVQQICVSRGLLSRVQTTAKCFAAKTLVMLACQTVAPEMLAPSIVALALRAEDVDVPPELLAADELREATERLRQHLSFYPFARTARGQRLFGIPRLTMMLDHVLPDVPETLE